ncbi:MAG: MFS transporter [Succinivibrionaceae bacterium]|nr:MFS transporter [Succinivibrionaceae bacterium]
MSEGKITLNPRGGVSSPLGLSLLISLAGAVFGFDLGMLSCGSDRIAIIYLLSGSDHQVITSTFIIGSFVGVIIGAFLISGVGRKPIINCSAALGLAACVGCCVAPDFSLLLSSQMCVGCAFGMFLVSTLVYAIETVPQGQRGTALAVVTSVQLLFALLALLSGGIYYSQFGIALTVTVMALSLVFILLCFLRLPESPRWLAWRGHPNAALIELCRIREDRSRAAREMSGINECVKGGLGGVSAFGREPSLRMLIFLLLALTVLLHASGVVVVPGMLSGTGGGINALMGGSGLASPSSAMGLVMGAAGVMFTGLAHDRMGLRMAALACSSLLLASLGGLLVVAMVTGAFLELPISGLLSLAFIFSVSGLLVLALGLMTPALMPLGARGAGVAAVLGSHLLLALIGFKVCRLLDPGVAPKMVIAVSLIGALALFWLIRREAPEISGASPERIELRLLAGHGLRDVNVAS